MPRQIVVQKALAAASANNIAQSQTPTSGTPLTLNGSAVVDVLVTPAFLPGVTTESVAIGQLDTQRRVLLTYGSEAAQRTMVISGTNQAGQAISETLTVPASTPGSVATLQDFFTVTEALPQGGGWSAAVTLGTNTVGSTQWFMPNQWLVPTLIEVATQILSGSANWSIEVTDNDPRVGFSVQVQFNTAPPIPTATPWPGLSSLTQNTTGIINTPVQAWRLTVNSGTGTVQASAQQAGTSQ